MTALFADEAWLPDGWARAVRIEIDGQGGIASVTAGTEPDGALRLDGPVMPGMPNLHGHAFQRAMAGLAERLPDGESTFWSWRGVMYRFAERMTPEATRAVAAQLYVEMLKAGYTAHAEFHYLHGMDGPQSDPWPMSEALVDAADEAGIALTLLPSLYLTAGLDGRPLEPGGQSRFGLGIEGFQRLVERLRSLPSSPERRIGIAPHSLRAVPVDALREVVAWWRGLDAEGPIHIHLAEQVREVRECLEATGRSPGRLLLESVPLDRNWCLIHATHLDDGEIESLAASGAVAGLCPTTEGNLGDGFFRLGDWLAADGAIGIGSDSHVSVDPVAELRQLDYAQRLLTMTRIAGATLDQPHAGASLWQRCARGGEQALGRNCGWIEPGRRADLVVLDGDHPVLFGRRAEQLVDTLVFSGNVPLVRDVMVGGQWRVRGGHHPREASIAKAYRRAVAVLEG